MKDKLLLAFFLALLVASSATAGTFIYLAFFSGNANLDQYLDECTAKEGSVSYKRTGDLFHPTVYTCRDTNNKPVGLPDMEV